jgi:hypothetical protein
VRRAPACLIRVVLAAASILTFTLAGQLVEVAPAMASIASSAPMPTAECNLSPYRLPADRGFAGRSWCEVSTDGRSEVYFDTYNNLTSFRYMYGHWEMIWQINMPGRYGHLYFVHTGSIQIRSADYSQLLWSNGAGRMSYNALAKYLIEEGSTQQTRERLRTPAGTQIWRY